MPAGLMLDRLLQPAQYPRRCPRPHQISDIIMRCVTERTARECRAVSPALCSTVAGVHAGMYMCFRDYCVDVNAILSLSRIERLSI